MKKNVLLLILLSFFLLSPTLVKADGLDTSKVPSNTTTTTPTEEEESETGTGTQNGEAEEDSGKGTAGISGYSQVERQEVKSGNERQSNILPLAVTLLATGGVGGGYFFYQNKMKRK